MEAFVYCWTDHKTKMLYIGSHKGDVNDGYICSSKLMLEHYHERQQDFTRQIVAEGSFEDIRKLEARLLDTLNVREDVSFYNQSNGRGDFYIKKHTKEAKKKMSDAWTEDRINPMKGKKHKPESIEKMRQKALGRKPYNLGIPHSEETKDKIRQKAKGRLHTEETKKKIAETVIRTKRSGSHNANI